MKRRLVFVIVLSTMVALLFSSSAFAWPRSGRGKPVAPPHPPSGFGSRANYICSSYTKLRSGSIWDGSLVTCFVPARLKSGNKAPVVVFLHGFLMVAPEIYQGLINHLVFQGNIVICPEANVGNPVKMMSDMDQNVFMQRAVSNANKGIALVGGKADLANLYVTGHSLGGLLGACWMGAGGARPKGIVLMNTNTDPSSGMPSFIQGIVKITPLDWKARAAATDVPIIILTGDQDSIAPASQSVQLYSAFVNAPSRVVYCLQGDDHGYWPLKADHNASMCDQGVVPSFLMNFMGGDAEVDAADSRFYWAAIDAMLTGQASCTFDMGAWSDGVPVKPVKQLAP